MPLDVYVMCYSKSFLIGNVKVKFNKLCIY